MPDKIAQYTYGQWTLVLEGEQTSIFDGVAFAVPKLYLLPIFEIYEAPCLEWLALQFEPCGRYHQFAKCPTSQALLDGAWKRGVSKKLGNMGGNRTVLTLNIH